MKPQGTDTFFQGGLRRGPEDRGVVPGPAALVIRFGGSLLERADWPELAAALLDGPTLFGAAAAAPTIVVGGGSVVEGLRAIDRTRSADPRLIHRLAIDGMGITARLVASTLGLPLVTRPIDRPAVLDMAGWLAAEATRSEGIPAAWNVTSDSLAAVVAAAHGGDLLLVKSVPPPLSEGASGPPSLESLAASGWVDGWFPEAAARVATIRWAAPSCEQAGDQGQG
jgi:aspartokinase-like uncharacterized kinase